MKFMFTILALLLFSASSVADETQSRDTQTADMVELVVTAEKISEITEKPQVKEEAVQGNILAELSSRLSETAKQI